MTAGDSYETQECLTCGGSGKVVEEARMTGENQHSACQMDCEDCDGTGVVQLAAPPDSPTPRRVPVIDHTQLLADLRRAYCASSLDSHAFAIQKAMLVIEALANRDPQAGGAWRPFEADQVQAWARALFEANRFYTPSEDGGWDGMSPNDGGIRDLHTDMAKAAKVVWDREAPPTSPQDDRMGGAK